MLRTSSKSARANKVLNSQLPDDAREALQQIATCLGYIVLQMSSLKEAKNPEKIRFLSKFGFNRNQLAAILDSTPGTMSKELSILKAARDKEEVETKKANG